MHIWMANVTLNEFEVCLRESRALDGGHNKIVVVSDEFMIMNAFNNQYLGKREEITDI